MLAAIAAREIPIPEHIDIFYLTREMPASEKTALQCVMEVDNERVMLEKLADELASETDQGNYHYFISFFFKSRRCKRLN